MRMPAFGTQEKIIMKVLAIGNSFAVDANRYLSQIARAAGETIDVVTLYIGGCSLEKHYRNMLSKERAYHLYFNGQATGFFISLKEALLSRAWDVVTMQQASGSSAKSSSYDPYAGAIAAYVRKCSPKAKLLVHQTWAYEKDSDKLHNVAGYDTPEMMFADIEKAYQNMSRTIDAAGIIPSGALFQHFLEQGVEKMHRDTFHATKGFARYALALLWFRMLTGKSVKENTFCDFDEPVSDGEVQMAKNYVESLPPLV